MKIFKRSIKKHTTPQEVRSTGTSIILNGPTAKTDAEIIAERGERIRSSSKLLSIGFISAISFLFFLVYAVATGNIGMITDKWNWLLELIGIKGHRLGTSKERISEKEARLKRFDNPKNMLDNMKED